MQLTSSTFTGFETPVFDAQCTFRLVLDAMAHPGKILAVTALPTDIPPYSSALVAVLLTLADNDTPVWIASAEHPLASHLAFHAGTRITRDPEEAAFAVCAAPAELSRLGPSFSRLASGTPEYPDRSATLILQVSDLNNSGMALEGPGIESRARLGAPDLTPAFWQAVAANHARFPLGIDIILVSGNSIAALPRSTRPILSEEPA